MGSWILENTVVTLALSALAIVVLPFLRRRPCIAHLVWLLLLVRLLVPPLPGVETPTSRLFDDARDRVEAEWTALPIEQTPADASVPPAQTGKVLDCGLDAESHGIFTHWFSGHGSLRERWDMFLPYLWILGSACVFLHLWKRIRTMNRLVRRSPRAPEFLEAAVRDAALRIGHRAPRVRTSRGLSSPMIWGFGYPTLLWPTYPDGSLAVEPSESILVHELAHLKRRDHWVALIESLGEVLLFWHPLFHFLRRQVRRQAEFAADAWVLKCCPSQRKAYAESLIHAAERASEPPRALSWAWFDGERKGFERRLRHIMIGDGHCRLPRWIKLVAVGSMIAVLPSASLPSGALGLDWGEGAVRDPHAVRSARPANPSTISGLWRGEGPWPSIELTEGEGVFEGVEGQKGRLFFAQTGRRSFSGFWQEGDRRGGHIGFRLEPFGDEPIVTGFVRVADGSESFRFQWTKIDNRRQ